MVERVLDGPPRPPSAAAGRTPSREVGVAHRPVGLHGRAHRAQHLRVAAQPARPAGVPAAIVEHRAPPPRQRRRRHEARGVRPVLEEEPAAVHEPVEPRAVVGAEAAPHGQVVRAVEDVDGIELEADAGSVSEHTFAEFRARSNQLARVFAGLGIERGDRVGIVLSQRPETAVAHLAAYKLGAVALPLSTLFGPEALEYRLRDGGAKIVVTDGENLERVLAVAKGLPALARVISVDRADADGVVEYGKAIRSEEGRG